MSANEMRAVLVDTFATLERWQLVVRSRVEPAPGSQLNADDEVWPWAPPSTLCVASLATATEHLHAIRLLVQAQELFPSATSTLARTALIAGGNAVWMLSSEDVVQRGRRMMSFAWENYRQHIAFGTESIAAMHPADLHPAAAKQMERLNKRKHDVAQLLVQLGGRIGVVVTNEVLPRAVEETSSDPRQQAQLTSRWRIMCGATHGLLWHHFGHDGVSAAQLDHHNVGEISVAGDFARLFMDYMTAFHITARGWKLLGERTGWPSLT